ncbi:hypothetical protein R5W24_006285 [Gemmata sp. JC717]|uniref:hypothetical protein n=1 Tax=Gemmata algarum TaxID=2975278 RepID=UPI0021BAEC8A|nr:hypothetical protein [Gemmata algarum]MDY3557098.1 hypothetical protein [Gemmata algarum]
MDQWHGRDRFWTTLVDDTSAGSTSLLLHREESGSATLAAEIVFWDAAGQYFVQTFGGDVPLKIIELLITEAKEKIKFK